MTTEAGYHYFTNCVCPGLFVRDWLEETRILEHLSSEEAQVGKPIRPVSVSSILPSNLCKPFKMSRNSTLSASKGQTNLVHSIATQVSPVIQD